MAQHVYKGRRYSVEEKAAAVRMVRALRAELGTSQGTTSRVAEQLGYGVASVRAWVRREKRFKTTKPDPQVARQASSRACARTRETGAVENGR